MGKSLDQDVCRRLRERWGWEYTPEQVSKEREEALTDLAAEALCRGITIPSGEGLREWFHRLLGYGGELAN